MKAASAITQNEGLVHVTGASAPGLACQPAADKKSGAVQSKPTIKIDYEADLHAYNDIELAYAAKGDYSVKGVYSPGVYHSQFYWIVLTFGSA